MTIHQVKGHATMASDKFEKAVAIIILQLAESCEAESIHGQYNAIQEMRDRLADDYFIMSERVDAEFMATLKAIRTYFKFENTPLAGKAEKAVQVANEELVVALMREVAESSYAS